MTVTYKDYYKVLGVDRSATQDEIKKAYRRLAREYHPDRNSSPDAAERFKEINEAYQVLGDPEKRKKYDQLGANWEDGTPFTPPPGWQPFGEGGGFRVHVGNMEDLGEIFGDLGGAGGGGGFSDFFEMLFGNLGFGGAAGGARRARRPHRRPGRGRDIEAEVEFSLLDLVQGGQRKLTLGIPGPDGRVERKTVTVNLPRGLRPGQKLRIPGHGAPSPAGGPPGDLYLRVRVRPEPGFEIRGDDLVTEVTVPAPLAVVGGVVQVETPEGPVAIRVAPGTQGGQKLRVRGKGLPRKDGTRGDLIATVRLSVPRHPTPEEKELWERLAALSGQPGHER